MSSHTHHHSHHHSHHGHAHHQTGSFNRAFAIAVSITFAYTLAEIGFSFYANSMSLLADAIHNFGDVLSLALAWLANWLLSIPARKRYSYGFKRTTILAALANAFILVATSAVIAYESVYKFFHPAPINESLVIWVGIIGIFVNLGSSLLFMKGAREDLNVKGAFLHLMADALILVGVVFSAGLIAYLKLNWIDPIVSLLIVIIILWGTWELLRDSVILLLDAIPHYIDHAGITDYLKQLPGVAAIHDVHIWGLSTREIALTAHLIMPNQYLTDADYRKINHILKEKFNIAHATIQVESGSSADPCLRMHQC